MHSDDKPEPPPDATAGLDTTAAPSTVTTATFGRFRNLELLGLGGMGRVYRAQDPTLGRTVALKLIRGDDPGLAERLLMEARAQARIQHPHVCRIYEVGEEEGRPYIVMQYVAGRTFGAMHDSLTLEQKLKLMKEVAEAVHAAHRVGLIHRDVTPANVMVERTEDGAFVPCVMDFGLAREIDAPGLTVTGHVLGTPWYMSPEQARGKSRDLDRRSDVYSLGATLYDLLCGRPPFQGDTSVDVLMKVLSDEPVPLSAHDPRIPADVQTIVMRCLRKEPHRRYDSARALADDIGRYLDGAPILARPSGAFERLVNRARRHRAAVATGAVALVLMSVFAAIGLRARATMRTQARLAAEFAETVSDVDWIMRVAHLAPLHDIRQEKAHVRERLVRIAERMRAVGPLGRGPGEYALGRGQLALGDPQGARLHLENAWNTGYRTSEVAHALGLALGDLYRRELEAANAIGSRELREARRREIHASLRDPAVAYLKQGAPTDGAVREHARGLLAFYEKRHSEALARAEEAVKRQPWLYEARLLQGDVHTVLSRERHETGDAAGSRIALEAAAAAYRAAAEFARSDPAAREGLCQTWIQQMEWTLHTGADVTALYEQARRACGDAEAADPDRADLHAKLANVHRYFANHLVMRGADPMGALEQAAQHARRAISLDPGSRRGHGNLGIVYRLRAQYESGQGLDPGPSLGVALEHLQKAVDLSAADADALNDLANAYVTRALSGKTPGGDPRADLSQGVARYDQALESVPDFGYAHANRGFALTHLARAEMERGIEPRGSLASARTALERAVALFPTLEGTHMLLAEAHAVDAHYRILVGEDPTAALRPAREELEQAARINPRPGPDVSVLAGTVELLEARFLAQRGSSPLAALDRAKARFRKAAGDGPRMAECWWRLGEAEVLEARWRLQAGQDAQSSLARGMSAFREAQRRNPKDAGSHAGQAELHRWHAESALRDGLSPSRDVRDGLAAADRALSLDPSRAEAMALKGVLLRLGAEAAASIEDRQEQARRAEEALQHALRLNVHLSRTYEPELRRVRTLRTGGGRPG